MIIPLLRKPRVKEVSGLCNTALHAAIKARLFPAPVKLTSSGRAVGFPENEVQAVLHARIAGKDDSEIRNLVEALHASRRALA